MCQMLVLWYCSSSTNRARKRRTLFQAHDFMDWCDFTENLTRLFLETQTFTTVLWLEILSSHASADAISEKVHWERAQSLQARYILNAFPRSPYTLLSPVPFSAPCLQPTTWSDWRWSTSAGGHHLEGLRIQACCILRWSIDTNFSLHIFQIMALPPLLRSSSEKGINCYQEL